MIKRAYAFAAGLITVAFTALLWSVRPPLHDLVFTWPLSRAQLGVIGLLSAWALCTLLAVVCALRAGAVLLRRTAHQPSRTWLATPSRRARLKLAPLALTRSPTPTLVLAPPTLDQGQDGERESSCVPETHAEPNRAVPRICVLGPLTISSAKQNRRGLRAAAVELIAYLALHPQGASRDELLEAIWPGDDPTKSRSRLYQATRDARRLLGDEAIQSSNDRYRLDRAHAHVDLDELEALLAQLGQRPEEQERRRLLELAVAFFADQPLAGSDYAWAGGELRRLRAVHIDLLAELGRAQLRDGDGPAALDSAERGIKLDPLNEDLWRTALEAEARLGMRAAVEGRYRTLRELLDERLGLEPATETRALYRNLLGQT